MPFRIEIQYMPGVPQAPARIKYCREKLKGANSYKKFGRKIEVEFFIDIPLERTQEEAIKALMTVSDPADGGEVWDAIGLALEAAFLTGVQYAEEKKAKAA